eukprot:Rhum_TRINITY_DN19049_c0_g1::Rhum_TRINITY_DN19049_c0_g1_i1::g.169131::m.169131
MGGRGGPSPLHPYCILLRDDPQGVLHLVHDLVHRLHKLLLRLLAFVVLEADGGLQLLDVAQHEGAELLVVLVLVHRQLPDRVAQPLEAQVARLLLHVHALLQPVHVLGALPEQLRVLLHALHLVLLERVLQVLHGLLRLVAHLLQKLSVLLALRHQVLLEAHDLLRENVDVVLRLRHPLVEAALKRLRLLPHLALEHVLQHLVRLRAALHLQREVLLHLLRELAHLVQSVLLEFTLGVHVRPKRVTQRVHLALHGCEGSRGRWRCHVGRGRHHLPTRRRGWQRIAVVSHRHFACFVFTQKSPAHLRPRPNSFSEGDAGVWRASMKYRYCSFY